MSHPETVADHDDITRGVRRGLAGPLDLYHRRWQGRALGPRDFVISADEKTQIQIRSRHHAITPPAPHRGMRVESEYKRHGTCAYLAAWDVHEAQLFGAGVDRISIAAFDALVAQVMAKPPYRSARRVFWVVDNGTIHRGRRAQTRLQAQWPNLVSFRRTGQSRGRRVIVALR